MKRIIILTSAVAFCLVAYAQPKFAYDVDFSTKFSNREYDNTSLDVSGTIFGARLRADAGISLSSGGATHRVLAGIDPLYEFGGDWHLEPLLYYKLDLPLSSCRFSAVAGAFPRSEQKAFYGLAFYSEAYNIHNDTFKGLQFAWDARNFHYEFGVDWKGMQTSAHPDRREQFVIYSGGHNYFSPGRILKAGYSAYMHHYANNYSLTADNVVDDILLSPYIEMEVGTFVGLQRLTLRLSYLQGFQRDRGVSSQIQTPAKGEFMLEARRWNVGVQNELFFGGDLMPLYDMDAPEGGKYAGSLYMGDPFMRNASGKKFGLYDRIALYWEPRLADRLSLRVQVNFHFNGGFAGHQEQIYLSYAL